MWLAMADIVNKWAGFRMRENGMVWATWSADMSNDTETTKVTEPTEAMIADWAELLTGLKPDICDDYRCTDDPDDETPGICVTFGFTPESDKRDASWGYQTGDNSFTGGAYGHPFWGVVHLYRDSDAAELASEAASEIAEQLA
jgi:hypothetical protein